MPARKEILKNCRQVIFHVFKHDLDEVGHFCKNRRSLKCFIEGMRTCLGLKRLKVSKGTHSEQQEKCK